MKTLTIVTRVHPARKNYLKTNIESIRTQTCNDYQHILLRDDKTVKGYGKLMANQSLQNVIGINGRYVMVLDDDDKLIDKDFIKEFKAAISEKPDIVFFRGIVHGLGILPPDDFWKNPPRRGRIASFCFAVKRNLWKSYISEFGKVKIAGDWMFLSKCYSESKKFMWLDRIVAKTQKRRR